MLSAAEWKLSNCLLIENMKKALSGFRKVLSSFLEKIQNEGEQNERKCDPLGPSCELGFPSLALCLKAVAVAAAADSAGETGALAGLEENDKDKCNAENQLDNSYDKLQNCHFFVSPFQCEMDISP